MAFNWISFLNSYRVPFSERGPNTSRGNVVVHCPFCGGRDSGMHMSVSTEGRGWRCFRDHTHRGKSPSRLVAALAGIDLDRARTIVGEAVFLPDNAMARVRELLAPTPSKNKIPPLRLPEAFRAFSSSPSARPYVNYLADRGFPVRDIARYTERYDLRYCTQGPFRQRVIFPVWFEGELVSWTGRSIDPNATLRYKALTRDPEIAREQGFEPSRGAISHYVLWYDHLVKADASALVLCEGPFDALKICVLGRRYGVQATCFFTSAPTQQQLVILQDLISKYRRRIVMLDSKGTLSTGIQITNALSMLGVENYKLPKSLKDPGEFDPRSFEKFMLAMKL